MSTKIAYALMLAGLLPALLAPAAMIAQAAEYLGTLSAGSDQNAEGFPTPQFAGTVNESAGRAFFPFAWTGANIVLALLIAAVAAEIIALMYLNVRRKRKRMPQQKSPAA